MDFCVTISCMHLQTHEINCSIIQLLDYQAGFIAGKPIFVCFISSFKLDFGCGKNPECGLLMQGRFTSVWFC